MFYILLKAAFLTFDVGKIALNYAKYAFSIQKNAYLCARKRKLE
jgi:hypothetical protein